MRDRPPPVGPIDYASPFSGRRVSRLAVGSCLLALLGNPWLMIFAVRPIAVSLFGHRAVSQYGVPVIAAIALTALGMALIALFRLRRFRWMHGEVYAYLGLAVAALSLALTVFAVFMSYRLQKTIS